MTKGLGLPELAIRAIAHKASHAYKTYFIPKRGGGTREIHHPSKELKALQRWLLQNVISHWPVHPAAVAYRRKLSIADHAAKHVGSGYLLRMDFQRFFPSITADDIMTYLNNSEFPSRNKWNEDDVKVFTRLVCRARCLTIGAPTSPALSNAVCFGLDHQLETASAAREVTYTRYADDLFFSTLQRDVLKDFPNLVTSIVRGLDCPARLIINQTKTRHSSKRGRRQVTGLVLKSDDGVGIGRRRKRYIRGLVHKFDSLLPAERLRLAGLLAFARSIEPDFVNALILKFGPERVLKAQQM